MWKMQMEENKTPQSVLFGKDNFTVTIYANIDYTFIVALILIFAELSAEITQMTKTAIKTVDAASKIVSIIN